MYVIPAPGLKVPDPDRRDHLPAEGREVPDTQDYWHRRLRDGDVVLGGPPAVATEEEGGANATLTENVVDAAVSEQPSRDEEPR